MEPNAHLGTSSKQRTARGEAPTDLGKSTLVNIKTTRQHQYHSNNALVDSYSIANSAVGLSQAGAAANVDRSARLFLLDQSLQRTEDNQLQQVDSDDDYERVKEEVDRVSNLQMRGQVNGHIVQTEASPKRD